MGHDEGNMTVGLTGFLVGAAIGAGVALLLAPKPGRELREDIRRVAREAQDEFKSRRGDLEDRLGRILDDISAKADELSRGGKDMLEERKRALIAAIEAGKQAYEEERAKYRSQRSVRAVEEEGRPTQAAS